MSFLVGTIEEPVNVSGTVLNSGPSTVYYRDRLPVSSATNDGSLASGASTALNGTSYFVTASGTAFITPVASSASAETALRQYDRDNGQAGLVTPTGGGWFFTTSGAVTANQARFQRFVPSRPMRITAVKFVVTTAASVDDACDVGIYSSGLVRLGSAGATTGQLNGTGVKSVSLLAPVNLQAGSVYYSALSVGTVGGTAAVLGAAGYTSAFAVQLFGATGGLIECFSMSTAHPLPDPATITGAQGTGFVLALA